MDDLKAKEALGLSDDKWILQFSDEEVRFIKNLLSNEKERQSDLMDKLIRQFADVS